MTPPSPAMSPRFTSGNPNFAVVRSDDQVAGQRHFEAAAECPSFDGRDERLAHHGLGEPAESTTGEDRGLARSRTPSNPFPR